MKIREIFSEFKWKFRFTIFLILMESALEVLFPLVIGLTVDGAIKGEYTGAIQLGGLGIALIVIGGGRRFFDSRFYAQVYRKTGREIISKIKDDLPSLKAARLGMVREGVEFMENAFPALIQNTIGIIGVILMIATLNIQVFFGSILTTFLVFIIYFLTRKKTTKLNSAYNDEIEKQVDVINQNDTELLDVHLKDMMKWNIKLSDLEMINFSISWLILISFLVASIILSAGTGNIEYGVLFSLVMYVFQYIESVISLPFFYQNWLRLEEIKGRLEQM